MPERDEKPMLGWREWVALPLLDIPRIKAKVDTGAKTSALHAFELDTFVQEGSLWVAFSIHPKQRDDDDVLRCRAPVLDQRVVRDSGGHEEMRYVIETDVCIGAERFAIEMTLTARDNMGFRMLLGRHALVERFLVDPARSFLAKKPKLAKKTKLAKEPKLL